MIVNMGYMRLVLTLYVPSHYLLKPYPKTAKPLRVKMQNGSKIKRKGYF